MQKKQDLRIIKTKNLLFNTFIELMKTKSFEEIKVSDICSSALINRSTFYSHYEDKYELLMDVINNLKSNLATSLESNKHIINTKEYYIEMIKLLLDHIDDKRDIYYSILINNRNSITLDILFDVISSDVEKKLEEDKTINENVPSDIITRYYVGAVVSVGIEWLKSNNRYTKNDMINYLNILIPENIKQI